MNKELLALALQSRDSFAKIARYIDIKKYERDTQVLLQYMKEYYQRDPEAKQINKTLLLQMLATKISSNKLVDAYRELLDEAAAFTISKENVEAVILEEKRDQIGAELAIALAGKNYQEADKLLQEFKRVHSATTLDEVKEDGIETFDLLSTETLLEGGGNSERTLKVYPLSLNSRLGGGVNGGDHLLLFARPEAGKTAAAITMACGFAHQGVPGIYIINEDRTARIASRMISNMSGYPTREMMRDPRRALHRARDNGLENIALFGMAPGSLNQIRDLVEKKQPRWLVVDQLRNIHVGAKHSTENKTQQLEAAATGIRNITKQADIVTVSVTQAGESAANKLILDMEDIDSSKTGIQGQIDAMIGIGIDVRYDQEDLRMFSLPKNKLGMGDHGHFPVRINKALSKLSDIES